MSDLEEFFRLYQKAEVYISDLRKLEGSEARKIFIQIEKQTRDLFTGHGQSASILQKKQQEMLPTDRWQLDLQIQTTVGYRIQFEREVEELNALGDQFEIYEFKLGIHSKGSQTISDFRAELSFNTPHLTFRIDRRTKATETVANPFIPNYPARKVFPGDKAPYVMKVGTFLGDWMLQLAGR